MPNETRATLQRSLVPGAALVILIWGLDAAREVLVPLTFAGLLGMLAAPAVFWLRDRRVPPLLGIPAVMLGVVVALAGFVAVLGTSVSGLAARLPFYQERLTSIVASVVGWIQGLELGIAVDTKDLAELVRPEQAFALIGQLFTGIAGLLSNAVIVVLILVFLLFEIVSVPEKLSAAFGPHVVNTEHTSRALTDVKRYVVIKTYVSLGTGTVVGIFCAVAGVDFPVLWGLLAFLLNFIPNIGSIIAGIPPVLIALVAHGFGRAAIVLVGYAVINMIIGNVIEPPLLGKRLGLSAFYVFLSLIVWGAIWGPAGMLLSVPLTMLMKLGFEASPNLRWVSVMMDSGVSDDIHKDSVPPKPEKKRAEKGD